MTRESIVVVLSFVLFFAPFLGIPELWKHYLISGVAVVLVLIGYSLRRAAFRRRLERAHTELGTDSFTESVHEKNQQDVATMS